ncbi:MFS transporter [Actinoallomurus sp. NPDC050550]|uniref:MFS transporter n=1 Tax=Actinoallomurus sp. NPDC050550 TaxID=3154937 RepID=UPI0033F13113
MAGCRAVEHEDGGTVAEALPRAAKALVGVRILNQLGAYALAFLAVLAGPRLAPAALAVFGVAALVSRWSGGLLLERLSPRATIALGLSATGAALLVLAAARTPAQTLAATALVGLAFEIYEPASQELLARVTSGGQRQGAYALLGTSLAAAGAVGGLLAAVLLPLGVRWLIATDALTCLAAAASTAALPGGASRRPAATARRRKPRRPPLPLLRSTAAGTAFAYGHLAVVMFLPLILLQRGAPHWLPGLAMAAAALPAPLTAHLARRRLEHRAHTVVLGAGSALLGLLALLMAVAHGLAVTVTAYLAWTAVGGLLLGRWPAMIADAAPEGDRPRWFAFFGSSWGIAQPVVPAVVAIAAGAAGGTTTAAPLTAAAAFLTVPIVLAGRRARP